MKKNDGIRMAFYCLNETDQEAIRGHQKDNSGLFEELSWQIQNPPQKALIQAEQQRLISDSLELLLSKFISVDYVLEEINRELLKGNELIEDSGEEPGIPEYKAAVLISIGIDLKSKIRLLKETIEESGEDGRQRYS